MENIATIGNVLTPTLNAKTLEMNTFAEGQRQIVVNLSIIIVIYLVSTFILKAVKAIHNYRLKSKMVEMGLPNNIVEQFLQPEGQDVKNQNIKVFLILIGMGLGSSIVSYFAFDIIQAIAIMSFAIAGSFLAYYIYLKKSAQ
jgi:hypothetical protein